MPKPRVFISSTCYDLAPIRDDLDQFIENMGYEPVRSEEGEVFYREGQNVQDSCLAAVASCHIFVLLIGGRWGSEYSGTGKSVTKAEYDRAIDEGLLTYVLVDQDVHHDYRIYKKNKSEAKDANAITYDKTEDTRIFGFIEDIVTRQVSNAIATFSNYEDIEKYLRQQWASLLHHYLTSDPMGIARLEVDCYREMFEYSAPRYLSAWKLHPTPRMLLEHEALRDILGEGLIAGPEDTVLVCTGKGSSPYQYTQDQFADYEEAYTNVRTWFIAHLEQHGLTVDEFLADA